MNQQVAEQGTVSSRGLTALFLCLLKPEKGNGEGGSSGRAVRGRIKRLLVLQHAVDDHRHLSHARG